MGLVRGLFYQDKGIIYQKLKYPIDLFVDFFWEQVQNIERSLPKYHGEEGKSGSQHNNGK